MHYCDHVINFGSAIGSSSRVRSLPRVLQSDILEYLELDRGLEFELIQYLDGRLLRRHRGGRLRGRFGIWRAENVDVSFEGEEVEGVEVADLIGLPEGTDGLEGLEQLFWPDLTEKRVHFFLKKLWFKSIKVP